jgi:hypothetical protein
LEASPQEAGGLERDETEEEEKEKEEKEEKKRRMNKLADSMLMT